jgi:hypothetical protein
MESSTTIVTILSAYQKGDLETTSILPVGMTAKTKMTEITAQWVPRTAEMAHTGKPRSSCPSSSSNNRCRCNGTSSCCSNSKWLPVPRAVSRLNRSHNSRRDPVDRTVPIEAAAAKRTCTSSSVLARREAGPPVPSVRPSSCSSNSSISSKVVVSLSNRWLARARRE